MLRAVFRVLFGVIVAALAAGLTTVSFVITPAELATTASQALPGRLATFGTLALLAATHSAIFAAPFALITAIVGEWQSVRGPIYYIAAGILIAMAGFAAQYSSEAGATASIANNYAFKAFLTSGFIGGLAYWMIAGRAAGGGGASGRAAATGGTGSSAASSANPGAPSDKPAAAPPLPKPA